MKKKQPTGEHPLVIIAGCFMFLAVLVGIVSDKENNKKHRVEYEPALEFCLMEAWKSPCGNLERGKWITDPYDIIKKYDRRPVSYMEKYKVRIWVYNRLKPMTDIRTTEMTYVEFVQWLREIERR